MNTRNIIEQQDIEFLGFNIRVLRKRIKNINLTIRTDGSISLSIPFKLPENEIYKFLDNRKEWIIKNKSKFKEVRKKEYRTGEIVEYLGLEYILNIVQVSSNQRIEINGQYLDIFVLAKNNNEEYIKKYIDDWYKKNLIYILTDLTEIWSDKLNLDIEEIRIRKLKRTWGSCNTKKKIITYSLELAKKKRTLIEYVVVHELAHLIHDNHGKEFKNLITKLLPDWKIRKKELNNMKKNGDTNIC